ncbi:hypothetical protein N9I35_02995 [Gammaproteobacteria bacterium]|nr:hypothetical protein [Gammaproteobacteria bacterium]
MSLFAKLDNYHDYLKVHPFHIDIGVKVLENDQLDKKQQQTLIPEDFNDARTISIPSEIDDLVRLHYLVISRKVTTVLEFGGGKSSIVFDHALEHNKSMHHDFVSKNLRRNNLFECHSIDNNKKWIEITKNSHTFKNVLFHHCPCSVSTFNSRICTYYEGLPNICPDLIYLDGPDQSSPIGNVRGINTNHPDRVPMAADILGMEHFLLPGTLIVVDGRTANARFLKTNFQRNWEHTYFEDYDQHFFELKEKPLGKFNSQQIQFCLGSNWVNDL